MLRLLQVSNYYYPEIGGIEKTAQSISDSLRGAVEERVICFTCDKEDRDDFIESTPVTRCGTKVKLASQQLSISMPKKLKKCINEFKPDVIIIHVPNPFLEYFLLKYIDRKTKLIVYWHSDIIKQRIGEKLFKPLTLRLLNRADKIVATSPNYKERSYYLSQSEGKCVIIPSCIDEDKLVVNEIIKEKADSIRKRYKDKIICVGVGRQVPYKGFEYVVKAMKELDDRFVLFLIGREGESTKSIKKEMRGQDNIILTGEVDNDTLIAYLSACDIFCFPSITKNEAFGLALAEGMYFGKPAITFTIPGSGVNFVNIDGITGIEVDSRNSSKYADAMRLLANRPDLRKEYGRCASERVRECFTKKDFKVRIRNLLNTL